MHHMLNNIKMSVVQTADKGVVNSDTIFEFSQEGDFVSANYAGGKIKHGYLVGHLMENVLSFCYCQYRIDGKVDHGNSNCILSVVEGKIKLEESFEMNTDGVTEMGINIFKEL